MENVLFVLSKITMPFFSPVFLFLVIMVIFLLRMRRNAENRRVRFWLLFFCFISFILSCPLVSGALARVWQVPPDRSLTDRIATSPRWDTVVVLGGGVEPKLSGGWQISVNAGADRLESAARLWHQGLVKTILVTGGSGDIHNQDLPEGPLMKRLLLGMGVAEAAIVVEDESRNTFENATNSLQLIQASGGTRLLLVTSALHMRRAEAIFRKALANRPAGELPATAVLAMDVLSVDDQVLPVVFPESFIPDAESIDLLSRVGREMVGYVSYFVLGRL